VDNVSTEKCKKCGYDGNGLHLCRGDNLFKKLLEIEINKLKGMK
jgi:hypothetical protein